MHPCGCCLWSAAMGRAEVSTHFREPLVAEAGSWPGITQAYSARNTVSNAFQRRQLQSHRLLHTRRSGRSRNLLRQAARRAVGTHEAARTLRSLLALRERGASVQQAIGSRARTAPFTAASTPTHRPCLLAHPEICEQTVRLRQSPDGFATAWVSR